MLRGERLVLGRARRGKRTWCLVPSGFDSRKANLRCDQLGPHVHVSHGDIFGDVAPDAIPKPLRGDFVGRGGLLARGLVTWLLFPRVLRARKPEAAQWAWLDSVRGEPWARVYFADLADGRLVVEAHGRQPWRLPRKRGRRDEK